jgi:hypothetical protein
LVTRNILDAEDIFSCLDPNFSLLVSEIRICQAMKKFRQLFDKIVIFSLEKLSEGMELIQEQHDKVRNQMRACNRYGYMRYGKSWSSEPIDNGVFSSELPDLEFFDLIRQGVKDYFERKNLAFEKGRC